jgi:hypothetical protein
VVRFHRLKYPGAARYPMTAHGPSDETAPPPNCPNCGKPLRDYPVHQFGIDKPEHGFFSFTIGDCLKAGF